MSGDFGCAKSMQDEVDGKSVGAVENERVEHSEWVGSGFGKSVVNETVEQQKKTEVEHQNRTLRASLSVERRMVKRRRSLELKPDSLAKQPGRGDRRESDSV
jgi:hypothetical protein